MKNKRYTLIGAMAFTMATGFAFTPQPEEGIKMTIVQHEGGKVTVYDTLVDGASGFTIEKYLTSKGIEPSETEIIHTNNLPNGIAAHENDKTDIYKHSKNVMIMENIENENGEENTVTFTKTIDGDGNVTIEKKVNGEIVEYEGDPNEEMLFKTIELAPGEVIDFEEEIDIKVLKQRISSEMEGNQVKGEGESGSNTYFFELDNINDDGDDESVEKTYQFDFSSEKFEGTEEESHIVVYKFISSINDGSPVVLSPDENINRTIAIVTTEEFLPERPGPDDGPDTWVSNIDDDKELAIENLNYFPNPSNGELRLDFFLPERGQTEITVFDVAGKEVYQKALGNFQGRYNEQLNLTNLEAGTYIMRISQNNLSLAEKLIIK